MNKELKLITKNSYEFLINVNAINKQSKTGRSQAIEPDGKDIFACYPERDGDYVFAYFQKESNDSIS
jgi:hypothetical protein